MQNNAPVPTDPQGGAPVDPKLAKQKKKEEAELLKKQQQEKRRQVELNMQLGTFSRTLATSVMDTSTMMKLACNTLKSMLQCDHVALALFETHPEIRQDVLCLGRAESNLPKLPPPPQPKKKDDDDKPKIKRMMVGDEVIEIIEKPKPKKKEDLKDKEPEKPKPMFPVAPKDPVKPGTLPRLEYIIWDFPLMYKMKEIKQPAMIPDPSKFPDPELVKFAGIYQIKSVLFVPLMLGNGNEDDEVKGVLSAINVNEPRVFTQTEIGFAQKVIQALMKAIVHAPPDLPVNVKKVITSISKDESSDRLIEYYSNLLDDIFDLIVYEMDENCPPKILEMIENFQRPNAEESKLRKIWIQIHELVRAEGELGNIAKRALHDHFEQVSEFIKAKNGVMPKGFKNLNTYVRKNLEYNDISSLFEDEAMAELIDNLEDQIHNALRGNALFTDKEKAVLINDVEQANMLLNYVSAPSVVDFRNHIRAAMEEETECPEEIDKDALLTELTYHGISEISKAVCQDLVERALFELPQYLEQPQEKQVEQSEALVRHFHVKIMANLITGLKGKKSVWVNHVSHEIKERAKEAAKKRAVLVGRLKSDIEEEEEY